MAERVPCPGCGARFPAFDGPTHAYLGASAGCWAVFGDVLAREYSDLAYFRVHQLTVDAYAAQHPGEPSRRTIQSVAVHLIALYLTIECGATAQEVYAARKRAVSGGRAEAYVWLDPPAADYDMTVAEVAEARGPEEHARRVREWADCVWSRWAAHHATIREWAAM